MFCDKLAAFTFWGWQAVIVAAAITLPLGYHLGKEYAELEWPIDILIALVWVAFAVVFFGTICASETCRTSTWRSGSSAPSSSPWRCCTSSTARRCRSTFWKSYSVYAGVQDALVQWWYGHNAVGFFLTAGFLGMMYYFIPKEAEPPGLLLPAVDRALLGADLHLHLGRPAPPALHGAAGLGAVARHGVLAHPARAVVGRHDQRHDDAVGRVAQAARRPDPQVPHRLAVVLRHVDLRGADDVDQDGQRAVALHRLDRRPRAQRRARLGRLHHHGLALLPDPAPVRQNRDVQRARDRTCTSGSPPSASCSTSPRCGSPG